MAAEKSLICCFKFRGTAGFWFLRFFVNPILQMHAEESLMG